MNLENLAGTIVDAVSDYADRLMDLKQFTDTHSPSETAALLTLMERDMAARPGLNEIAVAVLHRAIEGMRDTGGEII